MIDKELYGRIAQIVLSVRTSKNMTVQELGDKSGIDWLTIDALEANNIKEPGFSTTKLSRIAEALGLDDLALWKGQQEAAKPKPYTSPARNLIVAQAAIKKALLAFCECNGENSIDTGPLCEARKQAEVIIEEMEEFLKETREGRIS